MPPSLLGTPAWGLRGGYLALAGVLSTEEVYRAFYGDFASRVAFLQAHASGRVPMVFNGESSDWRTTIEVLKRGSGGVRVGIPPIVNRRWIKRSSTINQANYVGQTPCLRFCKMQILR